MDELRKALDIGINKEKAVQYLNKFYEQIHQWDVVMPKIDPIVLDFGLGDFERMGLIEFWIANEIEAGYCGKYLFVFDGQTCPKHYHKKKIETFFIVKGKVNMFYDGSASEMSSGDILHVEQGKYHSFTGIGASLLLELSMPCKVDDNYFENPDIPIGRNYRGK